jgi:hypothetical protein
MAIPTASMSPSAAKKLYKVARKSRSVTQLVLVDEVSHAITHPDIPTFASVEVASFAMPPSVP